MLIKILPGEYLWSESGHHVIGDDGFAKIATEECEVEVLDEAQLAIIHAYQNEKRQTASQPEAEEEPVIQEENTNG